ncbi:uncharacterized protein SCODWIG_02749 [Saccharomycodes ludwigii]|uniref:Uncharacterized protein n=2 Tax=Saccharomycodes ludwigii TaxID=36035 RepID=A0A376B8I6_9ASCO|nr:uncharacterized protein SCODWIG_02749 [Saccharomycodes ludwigii]
MSISITLQLWEWANISFNAYLSIGPLHRGTLLSSLSSSSFFSSPNSASPMETLISGLKSKNNFTKLTAFQELSYRARSSHVQFRYPIYHQSRQVWPSILAECFNTINDTNTKVSEYLLKVDTIGQGKNYTSVEEKQRREGSMYDLDTTNNGDNLFGNDTKTFENGSYSTLYNTNYYNNNNNNSNNNAFNIYSNKNIFLNTNKSKSSANDKGMEENFTSESVQTNILSTIVIPFIIKMVNIGISRFFFPDVVANSANNINNTVTDGTIIPTNLITENLKNLNRKLFSNVQRDSIRLCPLPNVYADSVLSLTGILLNALEEEPHSSCTGNIGDVLKILERSISILGGFVEYSEKIHKLDNKTEQEVIPKTVLSILYDLSVNAFLELVLRYNETLNNIYLDEEVKSLVKWVSEMINQE